MMGVGSVNLSPSQLEELMGYPRRGSLTAIVPITFIYCALLFSGMVGNIVTCIVISANKYMHTSTNVYLFNLAVADLLFLVLGVPQELYVMWQAYPYEFGETFCIVRGFLVETSTYASILTISAFTIERFVAICHPMKIQLTTSVPRAMKVVLVTWIVSCLSAITPSYQFGIRCETFANGTGHYPLPDSCICGLVPERRVPHIFTASTVVFFILPMTLLTILYVLIGLAVRKSVFLARTDSENSQCSHSNGPEMKRVEQMLQARRSVAKMLVAVVIAFFACWAPFHAQRLIVTFTNIFEDHKEANDVLYYVSGILYYVASTINPVLYNIMSLKFRQAFRRTISSSCCKERRNRTRQPRSYRFNNSRTPPVGTECTSVLVDKKQKLSLMYSCVRGGGDTTSSNSSGVKYDDCMCSADDPFASDRMHHVTVIKMKSSHPDVLGMDKIDECQNNVL